MEDFNGKRVSYTYTQTDDAPPDKLFPLLCPVRETDWLPGWKYRMIYSESGVAEDGCIFATPGESGAERVWMVTHYDSASYTITYAWVEPGVLACQLRISLDPASGNKTSLRTTYIYTALSPAGNAALANYTPEWFQHRMEKWEKSLNHYLRTGKLLQEVA